VKLDNIHFTPTENRLLRIFSDGRLHTVEELLSALDDDLAEWKQLKDHIVRLRKKIKPMGQDIMNTRHHRVLYYRQIRVLSPDE